MTRKEEIRQAARVAYIEDFESVTFLHRIGLQVTESKVREDCEKVYIKGAEWADRTMIDKVCGYLSKLTKFVCCSEGGGVEQPVFTDAEIELFKHKMMEE